MAGLAQGLPGVAPQSTPLPGLPGGEPMAPPAEGDVGDEQPNVTPEEQAEYERLVTSGLELIYEGDGVRPGIIELLDEDPTDLIQIFGDDPAFEQFSPVVALAATTAVVCLELARNHREGADGAILYHAGVAMLEELAEVSEQVTGAEITDEQMNDALMMALDLYREAATAEGLLDPAQLEEDFAEIKRADETGDVASVLPGFEGMPQ